MAPAASYRPGSTSEANHCQPATVWKRMDRHPQVLMRLVFVALVCLMIAAGVLTKARPRSRRDWLLVWAVLVLLAWALLGFAFLKSR